MYNLNTLLDRLSSLCESKSLSINQMLKSADLATSVVDNIKRGRIPSVDKMDTIASFFDCSIDYLLGRTNNPKVNVEITTETVSIKNKILPFYLPGASAGTGNWLSDDVAVQYMTIPKNIETDKADYLLKVRGDSMQPRFYNDDLLLVKKTPTIMEGEIGIFIVNGESFIKKMGRGELISLNPAYDNIKLSEFDDISCTGKVIGTLILNNYT